MTRSSRLNLHNGVELCQRASQIRRAVEAEFMAHPAPLFRTGSFKSAFPRRAVQIGFYIDSIRQLSVWHPCNTACSPDARPVECTLACSDLASDPAELLTSFLTWLSSRAARLFSLVTLRSSLFCDDVLTPARSAGAAVRAARWRRRAELELSIEPVGRRRLGRGGSGSAVGGGRKIERAGEGAAGRQTGRRREGG